MSFINKVKNFFYEDIEEDDDEFEAREAAKREAKLRKQEEKRRKAEMEKIEKFEKEEREKVQESSRPANDDLSERELFKSERTFNFPMDIGDDIFDQTEVIPEVKEESRSVVKEEKNLYARSIKSPSVTNTRTTNVEEQEDGTKKFHPTPVVSPVYGILDKNYTVEDVVDKNLSKTKEFSLEKKTVDFDTVRNKAYKELDEEIEKTLNGTKDIFFNLEEDEEKKEENDGTINDYIEEEYNKDETDTEDVIITYEGENQTNTSEEETNDIIEEDLTPDIEIQKEEDKEKKEKRSRRSKIVKEESEDIPEETSDEKEDLFNLIDNMYSDEEDEEEED